MAGLETRCRRSIAGEIERLRTARTRANVENWETSLLARTSSIYQGQGNDNAGGKDRVLLSTIATVGRARWGLDDKITLFVITIGGYFG